MVESLIAPYGRARFVVTLPPSPSHVAKELERLAGQSFTTHTDTRDAFLHLARRAKQRLVIMTPYVDTTGAAWAADLFEATEASERILILRGAEQLEGCGRGAVRLQQSGVRLLSYAVPSVRENGQTYEETFHAKIVLADGVAAYVGSANFLYRSREMNLECGFLLEGDAVAPVAVMVDALLGIIS
jgi:phosphatidylserine/phosphatidylglycerophosphate/cardiolipin synthase-like enzyme